MDFYTERPLRERKHYLDLGDKPYTGTIIYLPFANNARGSLAVILLFVASGSLIKLFSEALTISRFLIDLSLTIQNQTNFEAK